MNCEGYRDKLIAALAGGEASLDGDVAGHVKACADCKKFYEAQSRLFGAIDSGVRAMVNEAVPASLLPASGRLSPKPGCLAGRGALAGVSQQLRSLLPW